MPIKKQSGIALLVLVITIALTIASYYFSNISLVQIKTDKIKDTRVALKAAKETLIAYAKTRSDLTTPSLQPTRYGYLPCPANTNGDGNSEGACDGANENTIGWFPWRSLGVEPIRDGNGDCLLYAVSSTYKYSPDAGMLNEDANFGMFQIVDESNNVIYGDSAQNRVVAIIFSPGNALAGQDRSITAGTECDDEDNFDAYLDAIEVSPGDTVDNSDVDTTNTDRIDRFVQSVVADAENFNDQLLVIIREDIWPAAIGQRDAEFDIADISGASKVRYLTEALALCLASYANDNDNSSLPFPAPMDFAGNDYRDNDNYTDTSTQYIGRFPYSTAQADAVIPGSVAVDQLFDKTFDGPFLGANIWHCNSVIATLSASKFVDLRSSGAEEKRFWDNWKDRIVYTVSERYAARAVPATDTGSPRCNDGSVNAVAAVADKCISYNGGTEYAAMIIYAGEALTTGGVTQIREAPIAPEDSDGGADDVIDSKSDVLNYLELDALVSGINGDDDFVPTGFSNDLFFCLTDTEPVTVVECS